MITEWWVMMASVCIRLTSAFFHFPGVAWSFRFASLNKKKMVITNLPHLDINEWLKRLELPDYEDNFRKFFGVEDLINLSESEIKDLGVKNSSHRARMVSSLVALKGKKRNDFLEFEGFSGESSCASSRAFEKKTLVSFSSPRALVIRAALNNQRLKQSYQLATAWGSARSYHSLVTLVSWKAVVYLL